MSTPEIGVHSTAIVEDGPTWAREPVCDITHTSGGATVGRGCVVGKNVYIDIHAVVGDPCKLQNNVSVSTACGAYWR